MSSIAPPHIQRLVAYVPGKPIEELQRELGIDGPIVKLASNENPLGPSPAAVEAVQRAAREMHRYPDASGFYLRQALAAHHDVSMAEIGLGNGSNEILQLMCLAFATPEDHAVIGDPSFVYYSMGLNLARVPFTAVPLRDRVHWNVDDLLAAVRPETKLLLLANPNNPTGGYVPEPELRRLLRELPEKVIAVVDEAYVEFADAADYASALGMRDLRERLVVLRTFSKVYGLAAMRVGYCVASPSFVGYFDRIRAPFNVGALSQVAALAALGDQAYVDRCVAVNRTERDRLGRALGELGLTVAPSQANFVLADFREPGRVVYERLLREGVIVRSMPPPIDTMLRITVGSPSDNDRVLEAVTQLRSAAGARGRR